MRLRAADLLALSTLYLVWGSTFFAIHEGLTVLPPLLLAGLRWLAAGGVLYLWLRLRGAPPPTPRQWRAASLVALLVTALGNGLLTVAARHVPSSLCALLFTSQPLWAALAGGLTGRWPTGWAWLGLAFGAAGVALLQGGVDAGATGPALLVLAGAAAMGIGSVVLKHAPVAEGALGIATQMLCAGLMLLLGSAVTGEQVTHLPGARALAAMAYLAVFGSLVAYRAFQHVSKRLPPALATSYSFVNPVVAAALGVGLAQEALPQTAPAGIACVLVALALIALSRHGPQPLTAGLSAQPVPNGSGSDESDAKIEPARS